MSASTPLAAKILSAIVFEHRAPRHMPATTITPTDDGGFVVVFDGVRWRGFVSIGCDGKVLVEKYHGGAHALSAGFYVGDETPKWDVGVIARTVLDMFATDNGGGVYE